MTNNLGTTRGSAGMSVDAIIAALNDILGSHDAAITNGPLEVSFVAGSPANTATLTAAQFIGNIAFEAVAGSPGPSGASTLNVPATNAQATTLKRGLFVVINNLAQTLAVQVSGQSLTPPVLASDTFGLFYMDGSDVRLISAGAVGGGGGDGTFLGLTDTPGSYSGEGGKLVAVKADASGVEFVEPEAAGSTDWKESVRAASTGNLALSGEQTIDGIALTESAGDSVLAKDQTTGADRGIYDVKAGAWTRRADADTSAEVTSGMAVTVEEGTVNAGKSFKLTTADPITLGSTSLTFEEFTEDTAASSSFYTYTVKTAATHTLTTDDPGRWLRFTSTSAKTVTVPANATAAIPVNSEIIAQWGGSDTSGLTIAAAGGVTLDAPFGLTLPARYSWALLKKTAANRWTVTVSGGRAESLVIAASDETAALTTGTGKTTFRMPYAFRITAVRASLTTAQTSGSIFTVDINDSGTTILSTKLTIDNGEKTSTTAATPPVISDTVLADDAEITIDIDQVGDGTAKGLKVVLIGYQT